MPLRVAQALVLLVGLAGCVNTEASLDGACLKKHPGDIRCCDPGPGVHVDQGICCYAGEHTVVDVENPDWRGCAADEPCTDAGSVDAGADAP